LRGLTSLPTVIKGIQTAADAPRYRERDFDGMIVSNHGGFAIPDEQSGSCERSSTTAFLLQADGRPASGVDTSAAFAYCQTN